MFGDALRHPEGRPRWNQASRRRLAATSPSATRMARTISFFTEWILSGPEPIRPFGCHNSDWRSSGTTLAGGVRTSARREGLKPSDREQVPGAGVG